MSILSKVKSAAKKVAGAAKNYAKNVVGGAKIVAGGVNNALSKTANLANALTAPSIAANKAQIEKNIEIAKQSIGQPTPNSKPLSNESRMIATAAINSSRTSPTASPTLTPTTISGGQKPSNSRTSNSSLQSPIYNAPKDYTSNTPVTTLMADEGEENFSINSTNLSSVSAPSVSLPTAPSYTDPGTINNGGLIAGQSEQYDYSPETGIFTPKEVAVPNEVMTEEKRRLSVFEKMKELIPQRESVFTDPEVLKQQKEVQKRKQEVANYTAQLNSVVAQQNADLLRLRGIGSQEGVTETVYGGQAATINREAAIKALPIQAQLSAAQGNLELAQDYLTQITTFRKEELNNQYDYKKALYDSISEFVKGEDKIRLDDKRKNEDRAYAEKQANIDRLDEWSKLAIENGYTSLVRSMQSLKPNSPNFNEQLGRYTSQIQIQPKASGGTSNANIDNERALMTQFRGEPIVKDYNEILGQKGTMDAYIQSGVGGPADLAIVYSFMKGLDPTSVVRETEFATAAKSGNIFQGAFAKYNGYFKEKGGMLPANVRNEFQNLVNLKLQVKEKQYNNVKSQYEALAQRQGLDSQNVVLDYAAGAYTPSEQSDDDKAFDEVVPPVQQAQSSSWIVNLWNKLF